MNAPDQPLFVYGTLRDPELFARIAGQEPPAPPRRGWIDGYRAAALPDAGPGENYPALILAEGRAAEGVLIEGLGPKAWERLGDYEGAEYEIREATVRMADGEALSARVFAPRAALAARASRGGDWSFERWGAEARPLALAVATEMAALLDGGVSLQDAGRLWPDLVGRATARLALPGPIAARFKPRFGRAAVEELARERPYDAHFKVDRFELRHRRFEGEGDGWIEPVERAVFRAGAAAAVLPYDPRTDQVLLIEQFRSGPWAAGDADPWVIEVVAGRIDDPTEPDAEAATARRECEEEAGLRLGRLERIADAYASPGCQDEKLTLFVGEADLSAAPTSSLHGLGEEGEDIRAFTLSFDAAMSALSAGEIRSIPPMAALLWLARHRERLRALWR